MNRTSYLEDGWVYPKPSGEWPYVPNILAEAETLGYDLPTLAELSGIALKRLKVPVDRPDDVDLVELARLADAVDTDVATIALGLAVEGYNASLRRRAA